MSSGEASATSVFSLLPDTLPKIESANKGFPSGFGRTFDSNFYLVLQFCFMIFLMQLVGEYDLKSENSFNNLKCMIKNGIILGGNAIAEYATEMQLKP